MHSSSSWWQTHPHLDGGYSLFGRVLEGMEVADRIATVERDLYGRHGPKDRPLENVVIASIRIERAESAGGLLPPGRSRRDELLGVERRSAGVLSGAPVGRSPDS